MENTDALENRLTFGTLTADGFPCLPRALIGDLPWIDIQGSNDKFPATQLKWAASGGKLFGRTRIGPVDWATICQSGLNNGHDVVVDNMRFFCRLPDISDGRPAWPGQWMDDFWATGKDSKRGMIRRMRGVAPPGPDLIWMPESVETAKHVLVLVLEPILPDLSALTGKKVSILTLLGKGNGVLREASDYDFVLADYDGILNPSWSRTTGTETLLRQDAVINIGRC